MHGHDASPLEPWLDQQAEQVAKQANASHTPSQPA